MNGYSYEITLDINESQSPITLPIKKGDRNRKVCFSLTKGAEPFVLKEGTLAYVEAKKNGTAFFGYCAVIDNKIICDLSEVVDAEKLTSLVATEGVADCEVKITHSENEEVTSIASARFTVLVDSRVVSSTDVIKYTEIPYEAFAEVVTEYTTAENNRVKAEDERQKTFVAKENTRQATFEANEKKRQGVFEANETSRHLIFDYRNLYNGVSWSEKGKTLDAQGVEAAGTTYQMLSGKVYVDPDTTYTVNSCNRVCFYGSGDGFISTVTNKVFTTPSNVYYARVAVDANPSYAAGKELYFIKGEHTSRPEDVGFVSVPDILVDTKHFKNQSVTGEKVAYNTIDEDRLSFVNSNRDYFKGVNVEHNKTISVHGAITDYTGTFVSDFIEVKSNTEYIATNMTNGKIMGYTDEQVFIGEISKNKGVFTTPDNCKYIRVANYITNLETTSVFRSGADQTKPNTFTMDGLLVGMENLNGDVLGAVKSPVSSILADLMFTTEKKSIKLIGDSITHGMCSSDFAQSKNESDFLFNAGTFPQYRNYGVKCWAGMLKAYLEEKFNCTVTNNGASGAVAQQLIDNWDAIVSADDDVIICMIGTNDRLYSLETIYQNIITLCEKAQANNQKIIFMSAPPTSSENEENYAIHMEDIDNLYNYVNTTLNVGYISVYKGFRNFCREHNIKFESLLADGIHPNDTGYRVMFEIILEALGLGRKNDIKSTIIEKEVPSNKVTKIDEHSTDVMYPSAKAVVNYVDDAIFDIIVNGGGGESGGSTDEEWVEVLNTTLTEDVAYVDLVAPDGKMFKKLNIHINTDKYGLTTASKVIIRGSKTDKFSGNNGENLVSTQNTINTYSNTVIFIEKGSLFPLAFSSMGAPNGTTVSAVYMGGVTQLLSTTTDARYNNPGPWKTIRIQPQTADVLFKAGVNIQVWGVYE